MELDLDKPVLLFDGVCNLCNTSVQFALKHEPEGKFRFASLQSEAGQALLEKFDLPKTDFQSLVWVEQDHYYTQSTAALKVVKQFKGLWPLLYSFIIIPKPIRDWIYKIIARNRYRWFGKKEECMLPTPEIKERFLS